MFDFFVESKIDLEMAKVCTCRSVCACMCVFVVDEHFISELLKLAPIFEIATRLKSVFDTFFPSETHKIIQPAVETPFNNCQHQHSEAIVAHRFSLHVSNIGGGGEAIENSERLRKIVL